jgi:hypothetical protein
MASAATRPWASGYPIPTPGPAETSAIGTLGVGIGVRISGVRAAASAAVAGQPFGDVSITDGADEIRERISVGSAASRRGLTEPSGFAALRQTSMSGSPARKLT